MNRYSLSALFYLSGVAVTLLATSLPASAGGVALGSTRIIYPLASRQVSLPVSNSDARTQFLIQSWVSDSDGKRSSDFVVTPPLFTLKPQKENILRIVYTGAKNLPTDRESLYYFNSKAIPAVPKALKDASTLQIATQSVIKVFMRPADLAVSPAQAPAMLRCSFNGTTLNVSNPSPYYVTMVGIKAGGHPLDTLMVPPKAEKSVTAKGASGKVTFRTMNDYGAQTEELSCAR